MDIEPSVDLESLAVDPVPNLAEESAHTGPTEHSDTPSTPRQLRSRTAKVTIESPKPSTVTTAAAKKPPSKASVKTGKPAPRKPKVTRKEQKKEDSDAEDEVNKTIHSLTHTVRMRKENHMDCFMCEEGYVQPVKVEEDIGESMNEMCDSAEKEAVAKKNAEDEEDIGSSMARMYNEKKDETAESVEGVDGKKDETAESMEGVELDQEDKGEAVQESLVEPDLKDGDESMAADAVKKEKPEETGGMDVVVKAQDAEGEEEVKKKKKWNKKKKEKPIEDGKYFVCAYPNCEQRMHRACVDNFVCSEYSPRMAQLLLNMEGPICPAHICWHCYEERTKNASTHAHHTLIDCTECMRSYHPQCVPAGCTVDKINKRTTAFGQKRSTFVCHMHADRHPPISSHMRLKYCSDCENEIEKGTPGKREPGKVKTEEGMDDEAKAEEVKEEEEDGNEIMECKSCTNVFHKRCSFKVVKGADFKDLEGYKRDICTYCISGSAIVAGQYVLAYCHISYKKLPKGTYPGIAVMPHEVPAHIRTQLRPNLGKPGWVPVKWIWNGLATPYFNLIHISRVQRMFLGCEKNLATNEFNGELKKAERNFKAPTFPFNHEESRKRVNIRQENCYMKGLKRVDRPNHTMVCDCKVDKDGKKCGMDCHNVAMNAECTKLCDEKQGVYCMNRSLQRKKEEKAAKKADTNTEGKVEVKLAPDGKGNGLFARQPIKKGDYVCEYTGEVIDKAELAKREDRLAKLRSDDEWTYLMGMGDGHYVDARFTGGLARYANHSCDPNCKVASVDVPVREKNNEVYMYTIKLKMTALKDIEAGEEITFEYKMAKSAGLALDSCRCGEDNCIGKIGKKVNKDDSDDERFDVHEIDDLVSDVDEDENMDVEEEDEGKENKKKPASGKAKKKVKKEVKTEEVKKSVKVEELKKNETTEEKKKRRYSVAFEKKKKATSTASTSAALSADPSTSSDSRRRSIVVPPKKNKE